MESRNFFWKQTMKWNLTKKFNFSSFTFSFTKISLVASAKETKYFYTLVVNIYFTFVSYEPLTTGFDSLNSSSSLSIGLKNKCPVLDSILSDEEELDMFYWFSEIESFKLLDLVYQIIFYFLSTQLILIELK